MFTKAPHLKTFQTQHIEVKLKQSMEIQLKDVKAEDKAQSSLWDQNLWNQSTRVEVASQRLGHRNLFVFWRQGGLQW